MNGELTDIRAVAFDAVGTLIDPAPSPFVVYARIASDDGLLLPAATIGQRFLAAFRSEEETDFATGWVTSEDRERERWRRIVLATLAGVRNPEGCFQRLWDYYARPSAWRVNPDAEAVLAHLAGRNIPMVLASNFDARLHRVLDGLPALASLRDQVIISSEVGYRKPAPQFFERVCNDLKTEPARVLHVGDSLENDYEGARSAGCKALLLDAAAEAVQPGSHIRSLRELRD